MPCRTLIRPSNLLRSAPDPLPAREALRLLRETLAGPAGSAQAAAQEAEWLLAHVLGWAHSRLWSHGETALTPPQRERLDQLAERRLAGEPVAYVLGEAGFHDLTLTVTPDTLIPRPETELLVEIALSLAIPAPRVADLGTGSGAIALALAAARPDYQVYAVDRSTAALAVAETNARRLGLIERVRFIVGDWCAPLAPASLGLIIANPPYLADTDPHLAALRHEPHGALVAGATGLEDLAHIIDTARDVLMPGGWLVLEHGWDQGPAVRELLSAAGYRAVSGHQDFAGHDRVALGRHEPEPEDTA